MVKKNFDTMKWLRSIRDQISKDIRKMTDEEIIRYFRPSKKKQVRKKSKRNTRA